MTRPSTGKSFSIVVPLLNEGKTAEAFLCRLEQALEKIPLAWELIFIDDGSSDATWQNLLDLHQTRDNVTIISLSRRFGKDMALFAGLDLAAGDGVVVMDGDLQDPPEIIPDLIRKWEEGSPVVVGVRADRGGDPWLRRFCSWLFHAGIRWISKNRLPPGAGDLCLLDRSVVEHLKQFREQVRYFKGMISWIGFPRAYVAYRREPRYRGKSKWTYLQLTGFALDAVTSFSRIPLRILLAAGTVAGAVSFFYGLWLLVPVFTDSHGSPATALLLMLTGLQMTILCLMGEYLGHLFMETKQRPLYIVHSLKKSKKPLVEQETA